MWYRLFFAISWDYVTKQPLPALGFACCRMSGNLASHWGALAMATLARKPSPKLIVVLLIVYGGVLFLDNMEAYFRTGWPVAINGRYWVPFLPLVFALAVWPGAEY